jgi:hypothetical protein
MRDEEDDAPSGGGSASPGIDEDPEVLVTEWDVLADNMALMYQDAAEHAPAHAGSAPQNGAAGSAPARTHQMTLRETGSCVSA